MSIPPSDKVIWPPPWGVAQGVAWSWSDQAAAKAGQHAFAPSRSAEKTYGRQLRSVADQIASALKTAPLTPQGLGAAETLLRKYAETITPWAEQSATNMLADVRRKNDQAWRNHAARMGLDLKTLLNSPGVGQVIGERISVNAGLIKSIVTHAADQVAEATREAMISGTRAEDLAKRIARVGEVSYSRAKVIATTEVSKAGTALTQARAASVGSEGYIWRTARDGQTRDSHAAMEGKFVRWDSPSTLDGMTVHAGEAPNCRCYPEPVIPGVDGKTPLRQPLPTQAQESESGEQKLLSRWEREGGNVVRHQADTPLVNVDKAIPNLRKLQTYTLDPTHSRGKDKARRTRPVGLPGLLAWSSSTPICCITKSWPWCRTCPPSVTRRTPGAKNSTSRSRLQAQTAKRLQLKRHGCMKEIMASRAHTPVLLMPCPSMIRSPHGHLPRIQPGQSGHAA